MLNLPSLTSPGRDAVAIATLNPISAIYPEIDEATSLTNSSTWQQDLLDFHTDGGVFDEDEWEVAA